MAVRLNCQICTCIGALDFRFHPDYISLLADGHIFMPRHDISFGDPR